MRAEVIDRYLFGRAAMVGAAGFEPATLCSQSRCATRLRYTPPVGLRNGSRPPASRSIHPAPRQASGLACGPKKRMLDLVSGFDALFLGNTGVEFEHSEHRFARRDGPSRVG